MKTGNESNVTPSISIHLAICVQPSALSVLRWALSAFAKATADEGVQLWALGFKLSASSLLLSAYFFVFLQPRNKTFGDINFYGRKPNC
jgi:hypothetical protein